jgi:hypothetical protein
MDQHMKNEKHCSQLSTYFKRHISVWKADESVVCSDKTFTVSSNLNYYIQKQVKLLSSIAQ